MEKLFDDGPFMQKERPKDLTSKQKEDFYRDKAKEIIKDGVSDDDLETIIEDLKKLSQYDDGYELAKKLERIGEASYDIDTSFVEWLDWMFHSYREIQRKNERDWVKAHNIKPKLEIGVPYQLKENLDRDYLKEQTIYIIRYYELEGEYVINTKKDANGGRVIHFEIVEERVRLD